MTENSQITEEFETLPKTLVEQLRTVCAYVSHGYRYIGVTPYPDAAARFALGALHEYREREICEEPHMGIEEETECERRHTVMEHTA